MAVNQKITGRTMSVPAGLAFGAVISMSVTILAAAVLAKLVDMETLAWESIGYGIMVLLMLASFLGASASYFRIKRQRLIVCMMSGMVYFALLLSMTALLFGGQYEAIGVTAVLIFCGSACAGLLGLRPGREGSRRKMRKQHR